MANILTREIGGGSSKYPTKKSINLHIEEDHTSQNLGAVAIFAVFMVALGFFTKFFILDRIDAVNQAEAQYDQLQQEVAAIEQSLSSYDGVQAEYSHYGNDFMTDDEKAEQDRLEVLKVIEEEPLQDGTVTNVSISGNVATLTMKSARLEDVSALVANVESHSNVEYAVVSTANTQDQNVNQDEAANRTVVSTMTIYFKTPAEMAAEEEAAASQDNADGSAVSGQSDADGSAVSGQDGADGSAGDTAESESAEGNGSTEESEEGAAGDNVSDGAVSGEGSTEESGVSGNA